MALRRLFLILLLLVPLAGCNTAPGDAPPDPKQTPGSTATPGDAPPPEPIQFEDVKKGDGEDIPKDGAFEAQVKVWQDKFEGQPWGKTGELKLVVAPGYTQVPGLVELADGMKVNGVRRSEMTALQLFHKLPPNAPIKPDQKFFVEMTVVKAFPHEELKVETIKEGKGDKAVAKGDVIKVHYTGYLDKFGSEKVFDTSQAKDRGPFLFIVGKGMVIPGWDEGVLGMKPGEMRRLTIPHYLAYGGDEKGKIPPYSTLYFEVEMLEFVQPGELKVETIKEGKGEGAKAGDNIRMHYTGWTDKLDGSQVFDSSRPRNKTFDLVLGQGRVIKGWDQGLVGIKVGEVRHLTIPYNLGYGEGGQPRAGIAPYATLYFEVERMPDAAPEAPATPKAEATPKK